MPEPGDPQPGEAGPTRSAGGLTFRIITGLALAGLIFATLFTSRTAWFALMASAVLIAQWELYRALASRGFRPATPLGIAIGGILLGGAFAGGATGGVGAVSFGITAGVIATFLWYLVEPARDGVAENIAATLLGIVYVPFLGAHVWLMRDLPHGPAITVCYIGAVALYDIGAFAFGSMFGKRPIAPRVSPKKTWEGSIGATLFIFALSFIVGPLIEPFDVGSAALLAAVTVVFAPLGDLAESLIKRDLDIKDMGNLLPGHGGLLDRIDALLLAAAPAYWILRTVAA